MKALALHQNSATIAAYDFEYLRERYTDEHPQFAAHFDRYCDELRKFLELPLHCDGPLAAMSHGVDALWHLFITHTPQYAEFCDQVYGEYLHHQPRSPQYPVPTAAISNFYMVYPEVFGPVPDTWFEDIPPAHVAAVKMGQVPAALEQHKWSGWPGR